MQVGSEGSDERRRADEVTDFVLRPVLQDQEFSLQIIRADQDLTPGAISPKMLSDLLNARLIIADLTGRNPNVYYELGIAHSFQKTVISLGQPSGLPFDVQDERVIPLPPPSEKLGVMEAEKAKERLTQALRIVLGDGFTPTSPLTDIANRRSLDALAASDPVAEQLQALRGTVDDVRSGLLEELRSVRLEVDRKTLAAERDEAIRKATADLSLFEPLIAAMQKSPDFLLRFGQALGVPIETLSMWRDRMAIDSERHVTGSEAQDVNHDASPGDA